MKVTRSYDCKITDRDNAEPFTSPTTQQGSSLLPPPPAHVLKPSSPIDLPPSTSRVGPIRSRRRTQMEAQIHKKYPIIMEDVNSATSVSKLAVAKVGIGISYYATINAKRN